jgi:hypothetical protein
VNERGIGYLPLSDKGCCREVPPGTALDRSIRSAPDTDVTSAAAMARQITLLERAARRGSPEEARVGLRRIRIVIRRSDWIANL